MFLSLLAGCGIAFGAGLGTIVTQDAAAQVGAGIARLQGGSVFSVILMLVVVCGAELFTGNSLRVKAALYGAIGWENWRRTVWWCWLGIGSNRSCSPGWCCNPRPWRWGEVAARDSPGKLLACFPPIMVFVTSGFEPSVASRASPPPAG